MNKLITRSVLLAIVGGVLVLFFFKSRAPFGRSNSDFASEPQNEITKIKFSEGNQEITLEKVKDSWLIDGESETRKSGISFILRVLKELKIKSPVSEELFDTEITGKNIKPVEVKVYEKRKLLKSFLVYKTTSTIYGNIMKMSEKSKPFIVYVPDYEGDIGSAFSLNKLFWQPFTVFNLLPSEIASVDFENYSDTTASFFITSENHHFTLSDRQTIFTGWDSALVIRYLSYFTYIPFESWAFNMSSDEERILESRKPLYKITVKTTPGKKIVLTMWERTIISNGSETRDSDRLFARTQDRNEIFIIRYFDIDPLIKKRAYFFKE